MQTIESRAVAENKVNEALPNKEMVWIPWGTFRMGAEHFYPEEAAIHEETVEGFWIDEYEVTNADFAKFVDATRYVTSAEKPPNPADHPGAKPELLRPASVVFQKPSHR